jgi:hypothetical protein
MPQVPAVHAEAAFGNEGHDVPQAPQLFVSSFRLWHVAPQQVWLGSTQGCVAEQPGAQAFCAQISPAGQSVSPRHSTQVLVGALQCGVAPEQSLASVQPETQPFVVSQYCPVGH